MLVYAGMGTSLLLPSPAETFLRLRQLLGDPSFYSIIGHTFLRIFSGFLLGTAAGCILGGLTAFSPAALPVLCPAHERHQIHTGGLLCDSGTGVDQGGKPLHLHRLPDGAAGDLAERPHRPGKRRTRNCWKWHGFTGSPGGRNCGTSTCPAALPYSSSAMRVGLGFAGNRLAGK